MSSEAFFPWNDKDFQAHFPHGITMSVLALKSFSDTVLLEIFVQLAKLKVRYHFRNYKRLAIFGPASLVINLHLALIPIDIHLPIGPKQGVFTIMTRSKPQMPSSPTSSPTMATIFELSMGRLDLFGTRLRKFMKRPSPSTCDEDQLLQLLSLVIHLYFAPFPIDIQLPSHFPIGPKQRAFTIHMTR
jgi:hypothetical protein